MNFYSTTTITFRRTSFKFNLVTSREPVLTWSTFRMPDNLTIVEVIEIKYAWNRVKIEIYIWKEYYTEMEAELDPHTRSVKSELTIEAMAQSVFIVEKTDLRL